MDLSFDDEEKIDAVFYQRLGERTADEFSRGELERGDEAAVVSRLHVVLTPLHLWRGLKEKCESPIERMLLNQLVFTTDGYLSIQGADRQAPNFPWLDATLDCQVPVLGYVVDFLIRCRVFNHEIAIVIECDGHDFHERTKFQAARDRSRDRKMTASGYKVLRFTGSEIFKSSLSCACEVQELIDVFVAAIERRAGPEFYKLPADSLV